MATTLFSAFLPEVLPFVHDCPQIAAINAIRNAAIEFCDRSGYWQADLTAIDSIALTGSYVLVVPTGTRVVDSISAWYNNIVMIPRSTEELTKLYRGVDWRSLAGQPAFVTSDASGTIRLVPAPAIAIVGAINVRASIAPTRVSTGMDADVYEKQLEVIASGARARLLNMSGQPAYDPVQASAQRTAFLAGCNNARIRANKASTRASVSIEIPRYI